MAGGYMRGVLLRLAGAMVSIAVWLGLIVLALSGMDSGVSVPEGLRDGWPLWIGAAVIVLIVIVALRRATPGPGWGSFAIGLLIPEVAFAINRLFNVEVGRLFWIVTAALILVPLPRMKRTAAAAT